MDAEKRGEQRQMVDAGETDNNGRKPRPLPIPVPTPVKPGRVTTYDIAKAYLDSLHATLWPAEAWYIRDEDGQDAAAVWITQMVDNINAIRNMVNGTGMSVAQAAEDYRRMVEG